jgi:hypothetical protein
MMPNATNGSDNLGFIGVPPVTNGFVVRES